MKTDFLLFSGGSVSDSFLGRVVKNISFQHLLCVDKGLELAYKCGFWPDYLVGDFDSVKDEVLKDFYFKNQHNGKQAKIIKLNPVKDATDTEEAISLALKEGAVSLLIVGATGGRLDHLLANIHGLLEPLKKEVPAMILDEWNLLYLKDKSFMLRKSEQYGTYLSLLPLTSRVEGLTLEGVKYPLNHYSLRLGPGIGVSNEITEEEAGISFEDGILIVTESCDATRIKLLH